MKCSKKQIKCHRTKNWETKNNECVESQYLQYKMVKMKGLANFDKIYRITVFSCFLLSSNLFFFINKKEITKEKRLPCRGYQSGHYRF